MRTCYLIAVRIAANPLANKTSQRIWKVIVSQKLVNCINKVGVREMALTIVP